MNDDKEALEVLVEKLVIISHLYDREFRNYLENGQNPLKILFNKKFSHYSDELVLNLFNEINAFYISELEKLYIEDMKRLNYVESYGRFILKHGISFLN